jgi:hypothetical protein
MPVGGPQSREAARMGGFFLFICLPVSACETWEVVLMVVSILLTVCLGCACCYQRIYLGEEEPELPLHQRRAEGKHTKKMVAQV